MVALLVALALTAPPKAWLDTGSARVPLAVSSWCWGTHCGAPIAASTKTVTVKRGATVHLDLSFAPTRVAVDIGGAPVKATFKGRMVSWRVARGGGVSINVGG